MANKAAAANLHGLGTFDGSVLPVIIQQPQMQLLQPQMPSAGNMAASHSILPKCRWLPSFLHQRCLLQVLAHLSSNEASSKKHPPC